MTRFYWHHHRRATNRQRSRGCYKQVAKCLFFASMCSSQCHAVRHAFQSTFAGSSCKVDGDSRAFLVDVHHWPLRRLQ